MHAESLALAKQIRQAFSQGSRTRIGALDWPHFKQVLHYLRE